MRALSFSLVASLALAACSSDSGNPSNPAPGGSGGGGSTSLGGAGSPAGGSGGAPAGSGGVAGAAGTGGGLAGAAGASGGMAGACGGGMSGGGAGSNGGTAEYAKPTKLSQTGLYADVSNGTLAPGVLEYRPKYELWSDSAVKRRWVYLPPCSKIDTTGTAPGTERSAPMDFWRYPVGTKLWKEFSRDGVRVETRLIEKYVEYVNGSPRERWFMSAFVWNEALSDADVTVDGVQNARGTMHDVPSQTVCADCHDNMYDRVLGFSAIQLSHTLPGVKLSDLVTSNQLTAAPAAPIVLPGTEAQQNVLGYLHANCGHCHNENSQHSALNMVLWLSTGSLGSLEATPTVATTRNQPAQGPEQPDDDLRIVPGQPAQSELFQRLTIPFGDDLHMPRVGTEMLDQPAITAIEAFITSLPSAP